MWGTTTGVSLFLAGSTGVVAAIFGAVDPEKLIRKESRPKKSQWSDGLVIVCLFVLLLLMIAGLIVLSSGVVVDTPGGETNLPTSALYSIVGITVVISTALVYWMVRTRCRFRES